MDELLTKLGELTADFEDCNDYFAKRKIHNEMGIICDKLDIPNIEFINIYEKLKL